MNKIFSSLFNLGKFCFKAPIVVVSKEGVILRTSTSGTFLEGF